jgi:hypothetical protein
MNSTPRLIIWSAAKKKIAARNDIAITMREEIIVSRRVGQVTFPPSARTCWRKVKGFVIFDAICCSCRSYYQRPERPGQPRPKPGARPLPTATVDEPAPRAIHNRIGRIFSMQYRRVKPNPRLYAPCSYRYIESSDSRRKPAERKNFALRARSGSGTDKGDIRLFPRYPTEMTTMARIRILALCAASALACGQAHAQTSASPVPPQNSMKLSELVAKVESRDKFQYVKEIEWESEGYYDVTYYTTDKAKVEIKLDPVSGQPK